MKICIIENCDKEIYAKKMCSSHYNANRRNGDPLKLRNKNKNGERAYRGHEIQDWLDRHPEVTNWVALDDDSDFLDSQLRNLVQADGTIGLTETLAYRATYILNNGPNHIC